MESVKGLKELHKALKNLGSPRTADSILRSASRAGAVVLQKKAENNLISGSGTQNKKKIVIERSRRGSNKYSHLWRIGPRKENWELAFLEYGVPPHDINPKNKKALTIFTGDESFGGAIFATHAQHPGIKRVAFMRRAAEANPSDVVEVIKKKAWDRIKKEAK